MIAAESKKKAVTPKQRVTNRRRVRAVIQLFFFVLAPSVYTAAFSGVKEIATAIGSSQPIAYSSFVGILLGTCIYTIFFGRFFCGYACAFGAFGDAVYALSQQIQCTIKRKLPVVPEAPIHGLQKIKYVILVGIVALCAAGVYAQLPGWSPWDVFSMLTAWKWSGSEYLIGIIVLIFIVIGMAVKERFFCQFLCPMGAIFALLPVIGRYTRDRENCLPRCAACARSCPVNVETDADNPHMGECISCGKCSDICPKRNISYSTYVKDGNALFSVLIRAGILFALCLVLGAVRTFG